MYHYYLIVLILSPLVSPLPDGAPSHVCDSMAPFHAGGIAPQSSASPFNIFPDITTLMEDQPLRLTLGSKQGLGFGGFMLQGRTSLAHDPVGTFVGIPEGVKLLNCKGKNDTVTHSSAVNKGMLEFDWVPPKGFRGDVIFNATIAQNYGTFWVGVESPIIRVVRKSEISSFSQGISSFYRGCGITNNCFGIPQGCIDSQSCKAAVRVNAEAGTYSFEMLAPKEAAYVAVGLSEDDQMGDDSVLECVKDNNGRIMAYMSRTFESKSQGAERLPNHQDGIQLLDSSVTDGQIYCKVKRRTITTVGGVTYDLANNKYNLLLATGRTLKPGRVGYHDIAYMASKEKKQIWDAKQMKTTTPPNFTPNTDNQVNQEDDAFYNGCASEKGCFGAPDGCVKTKDCIVAVATTVKGERYEFEIKAPRDASYVAVGLSDDSIMGDDSVIECVREGNTGVKAYMSRTIPRNNLGVQRLQRPQDGIQLLDSSTEDGQLYCKVLRDTRTTVNGKTYDLVNDQYVLLVAAGRQASASGVGFHDLAYLPAGEKRYLSDVSEVAGASKLLLRLHGAFMLVAWVGTASIGILIARYYRQTWVGSQICGKDLWFAWHRFFMVCTWTLTIVAFILIFVELNAWSSERNPHAILGMVTTIICFLQPIGAFFRPHPGTPKRAIFNWLHWLAGNVAHILGIVTIFFAVKLNKAELPDWLDWILVGYVAFHVLIHLILSFMSWLQILGCISDRTAESRVTAFPMKDLGANGRTSHSFERSADAPKSGLRRVILFLYLLIIIIFVVVMVIIAVLAPIGPTWAKLVKSMRDA